MDNVGVKKKSSFQFWRETLNSAKYVVAPMVDQSELAWRMLSRRYGAELCYTPMLHACVFAKDANYRKESLQTCLEDRPLIIQFCANDPQTLLKAAQLAVDECECDGVDLNLGCPQIIAKRGHYGAYLQDEWELLKEMVTLCHANLKVNITCKIRILESIERTVQYAKMLEAAGCQLLTVHGRTRDQKGKHTGLADWSYIKAVREAVNIPVFANGNIQYLPDVGRCMEEIGVQGVMIAEGNLHNPTLFHGKQPLIWDIALEYLDYVDKYPCPLSYVRGHMFKLLHHALNIHRDVREIVASGKSTEEFREAALMMKEVCQGPMKTFETKPELYTTKLKLPVPYWICQPYVRPSVDEELNSDQKEFRLALNRKRAEDMAKIGAGDTGLSNNKLKKMLKNPNKNFNQDLKNVFETCQLCPNPRGMKCEQRLCKSCCRQKANKEIYDCIAHKVKTKTIADREKLKQENNNRIVSSTDNVDSSVDITSDPCMNSVAKDVTEIVSVEQSLGSEMAGSVGDQSVCNDKRHKEEYSLSCENKVS